jgi:hypothetical protein
MIFGIDQYLPDRRNEIFRFPHQNGKSSRKIFSSTETSLNEKRSVKKLMGWEIWKTFRNHEIKFY